MDRDFQKIIRLYDAGAESADELLLPQEYALRLMINGSDQVTLICTQEALRELIVGFLYNENIVSSIDEIQSLNIDETASIANIRLAAPEGVGRRCKVRGSGLGGDLLSDEVSPVRKPVVRVYTPDMIRQCAEIMDKGAVRYKKTGGVHCSALFRSTNPIFLYEDIGRHNTLDKICGACLLHGIDPDDTMLLTTGRISSDMIRKSAKMGVSLIGSYSTPTQRAYEIAKKVNITVVGHIRKQSMCIYTAFERTGLTPR